MALVPYTRIRSTTSSRITFTMPSDGVVTFQYDIRTTDTSGGMLSAQVGSAIYFRGAWTTGSSSNSATPNLYLDGVLLGTSTRALLTAAITTGEWITVKYVGWSKSTATTADTASPWLTGDILEFANFATSGVYCPNCDIRNIKIDIGDTGSWTHESELGDTDGFDRGSFTYIGYDGLTVNGKDLRGAWVPSLDTEGYGTTTLMDLTGNSNHGTLLNMETGDWESNTGAGGAVALRFDGSDEAVGLPNISITSGWSCSLWAQFDSASAQAQVFSKASSGRFYISCTATGKFMFRVGIDASQIESVDDIVLGQWYHLVLVIAADGLSYEGFVDGVSQGTSATGMNSSSGLGFGAYFSALNNPTSYYFDGLLDDVRLFGEPLDADDIAYLGTRRGVTPSVGVYSPFAYRGGSVYSPFIQPRIR